MRRSTLKTKRLLIPEILAGGRWASEVTRAERKGRYVQVGLVMKTSKQQEKREFRKGVDQGCPLEAIPQNITQIEDSL
jgi:hypothetical protein